MHWIKQAACAALLAASAGLASAATITLDFETAPGADGQLGTADDIPMPPFGWVRDEYASLGITFTQGTVVQSGFFDSNPLNHFITSTSPIGFFTRPVFGISIESYSMWNATLSVFDAAGNLLASDRITNNTGSFMRELLSVTTTNAIHSFSILPDSDGPILNLDNMTLEVGEPAAAVPEPAVPALMLAGLGVLGFMRRRAKN
jgi:hypothetical protein